MHSPPQTACDTEQVRNRQPDVAADTIAPPSALYPMGRAVGGSVMVGAIGSTGSCGALYTTLQTPVFPSKLQ